MQMPATEDTIVAVSSGWQPTPVAIVRLSGPGSFGLAARLRIAVPSGGNAPLWTTGRLHLSGGDVLPTTVLWFRAPRSFTGQDVAEIHTVGCLPLLRELSAELIALGARRALPGEFTARAFMNGRLDATQVQSVLTLMQSEHHAAVRQAARLARGTQCRRLADLVERMTQLLAHIEAGIDFVEEEDIQFVTRDEVVATLDALIADLGEADADEVDAARGGRPHVACAGLPNAGKSTLFNALVGYERALVSPVLGTTRDVLAAEVELDGVAAVFQDCAGLGASADEIALASHLATERTMQLADLVLWVHAADMPWDERETAACAGIEPDRRVLVLSKVDLASRPWGGEIPVNFPTRVGVCALNGTGMGELRATLARRLATGVELPPDELRGGEHRLGVAALRRARDLADSIQCELLFSDLIALELRAALAVLARETHQSVSERLLDHIFAEFCVGK